MGRSIPVTLGRFTYASKKAAKDDLRGLRDAHRDGRAIRDEDAVELLLAVVASHPQADEKIGDGIRGFFVARAPDHPTYCFHLRRVDGSTTDFSWNEAITPTRPVDRLRMACRGAIKDQKDTFKAEDWPSSERSTRTCPITGKAFTRDDAVVDHQPPSTVKALVEEWLASLGLRVEDIPIVHTGDQRSEDTFADDGHRQHWRAFHGTRAQLRLVSSEGNLIQGSRTLDR